MSSPTLTQISDATIRVNQEVVGTDPGTITFDTGDGEQSIRLISFGGTTVQVYSNDLTTQIGSCGFTLPFIIDFFNQVRSWKQNKNDNTVSLEAKAGGKNFSLVWNNMAVTGRIQGSIGPEGAISVEFSGDKAI